MRRVEGGKSRRHEGELEQWCSSSLVISREHSEPSEALLMRSIGATNHASQNSVTGIYYGEGDDEVLGHRIRDPAEKGKGSRVVGANRPDRLSQEGCVETITCF
jgi:hypothetical protein